VRFTPGLSPSARSPARRRTAAHHHDRAPARALGRAAALRLARSAALALAVLALGGCEGAPATGPDATKPATAEPKEVSLVPVTAVPVERTVEVSGTLDAFERVTVAAKVPGRVAELPIDLASRVAKGDLVARLDVTDYQLDARQAAAAVEASRAQLGLGEGQARVDPESTAVVRQARATVEQSKLNVERARALAAEGIVSAGDLEAAEAAAARAEAALQTALDEVRIREATLRERASGLARARQALADTAIVSPIDGVVQARHVDVGEYVAAGATIAEVVRVDPLRLRVAVPEREAALVRAGRPVRVQVEGDPTVHEGTIARVAPAIDPASRTLLAEADVKNPGTLRPGSLVTARIVVAEAPAPTVPSSAIIHFAGLAKVVTVKEGKAVEVEVKTGAVVGDRTEIVSGVEPGTRVVAAPGSLRQGQAVRVAGGS
jgi:RND family efflux transporter MFP subunit